MYTIVSTREQAKIDFFKSLKFSQKKLDHDGGWMIMLRLRLRMGGVASGSAESDEEEEEECAKLETARDAGKDGHEPSVDCDLQVDMDC